MMLSEFTERTGFVPTDDEYSKIEDAYYNFAGNKDAFCQSWLKDGGIQKALASRLERIRQLEGRILEMEHEDRLERMELDRKLEALQKELDNELEWKPCRDTGTQMEQDRYEKLLRTGRQMSDEEAKAFIADECGFDVDKIKLVPTVETYDVNKYHRLRKAAAFDRVPLYEATDWNYVRFDCAQFAYEFINGELRFYEH